MEYALVISAIALLPFVIGWLYGRNTVSPYTAKGKAYYNSTKED